MYEPKSSDGFNTRGLDSNQSVSPEANPDGKSTAELAREENLSPKNVIQREQQLKGLFVKLIGFGLAFGVVLAIAIVFALKKFGLAEKPYERENRIQQEQLEDNYIPDGDVQ